LSRAVERGACDLSVACKPTSIARVVDGLGAARDYDDAGTAEELDATLSDTAWFVMRATRTRPRLRLCCVRAMRPQA
jgi:hypothetical protein